MSLQALGRPADRNQRLMPALAALAALAARVKPINERCKQFFMQLLAAMEESKRKEGARLIRRYRHLIDDPLE